MSRIIIIVEIDVLEKCKLTKELVPTTKYWTLHRRYTRYCTIGVYVKLTYLVIYLCL